MKKEVNKVNYIILGFLILVLFYISITISGGFGNAWNRMTGNVILNDELVYSGPTSPPAPNWTDDLIIYQMRVDQFTPNGTFNSAKEKLSYLQDLGITAILLNPVAEFYSFSDIGKNQTNIKYTYYGVKEPDKLEPLLGTEQDFKDFVNESHSRGIKVFLDIVTLGTNPALDKKIPISGDWNNDKNTTIGLYGNLLSKFYLGNSNKNGSNDISLLYGPPGARWIPFAGDWNGDGKDTIGIYNINKSIFYLRNLNNLNDTSKIQITFGAPGSGWIPIKGDWNGDGIDTIGIYNPNQSRFYLRNTNNPNDTSKIEFVYGTANAGWLPIAGDWNGDGIDTIGLFDPVLSRFYLRNSNTAGASQIIFLYGSPRARWLPITGDWNGDGIDTVGLYNSSNSRFYLRNSNKAGAADLTFVFLLTYNETSPFVYTHPNWFKKDANGDILINPTFRVNEWNYSNIEFKNWWENMIVNDWILKYDLDGLRLDLEPGVTNFIGVWTDVRNLVAQNGKNIVLFSESTETEKANASRHMEYHFTEWGFAVTKPVWPNGIDFMGRDNIVDVIKSSSYNEKFYTTTLSYTNTGAVDGYQQKGPSYNSNGNLVYFGYSMLISPFIPVWYMGEEFNNTCTVSSYSNNSVITCDKYVIGQYNDRLYFTNIKWEDKDKNIDFYNKVKKLIQIRKQYKEIITPFEDNLNKTRIIKVSSTGSYLQSYALYKNKTAIIVVGNRNSSSGNVSINIPLQSMSMKGLVNYSVTDLMTDQCQTISESQLGSYNIYVENGGIAVLKVEGGECKVEQSSDYDTSWSMFEEIVGGSGCYGDGIGEVKSATDTAFEGSYSLRVWSNKNLTSKSNHVIAQKKVFTTGKNNTWRYEVYAYIDPITNLIGQTGPEFSMQNTRQISPGVYRTATAGMQYIANSYISQGNWSIWAEKTAGVADWFNLVVQPLTAGKWYHLILEADYDTNKYVSFKVQGNGVDLFVNLSNYRIAQENKFSEEAFWLTLESENLWNNCGAGGAKEYKLYYDNINLTYMGPRDKPDPDCDDGNSCTTITCNFSSNCGTNKYSGTLICDSDKKNVMQNYTNFTCIDPGTASSYCSNITSLKVKDKCSSAEMCLNAQCKILNECSDCGSFWGVGCTYDSCHGLGNCYYDPGFLTISSVCQNVTEVCKTKNNCSSINQDECNNDICGLNCKISQNQCVQEISCTPNCTNKQCGSNGCNGYCGNLNGDCPTGQECNPNGQCQNLIPICSEGDWQSSISPTTCPSNGQQTKTWIKIGQCSGGINHSASESISCIYQRPTCISFTYSEWEECTSSGTQTRNVLTSSPDNCQGGNPVITQQCNYIPPCTETDWNFTLSPQTCPSNGQQTRTWTKSGQCSGGINHYDSDIISCTQPTCINFTYSSYGECTQSGTQTRTIVGSSPVGCSGGNPVLNEQCIYIPQCTEADWNYSINPTVCPSNGQQTKTWTKTGTCSEGVNHSSSESITCVYQRSTCTNFTYSIYGECTSSGTQIRQVLTSSPDNCQGGNPNITKQCTYIPPCTNIQYSDWSDCNKTGSQQRTIISSSIVNCSLGTTSLTDMQTCNSSNYIRSISSFESKIDSNKKRVSFKVNNTSLIELEYSRNVTNVNNLDYTIKKGKSKDKSYLIVHSRIRDYQTKKIYLEINESSKGVCILDQYVENIEEMKYNCTYIICPGIKRGYNCTKIANTTVSVSGLRNSAVMEMNNSTCGDQICTDDESCNSCNIDCGNCYSPSSTTNPNTGSGSYSGSGSTTVTPGENVSKNVSTKKTGTSATSSKTKSAEITNEIPNDSQKGKISNGMIIFIIIISVLVIAILLIIIFIIKDRINKKHEMLNDLNM